MRTPPGIKALMLATLLLLTVGCDAATDGTELGGQLLSQLVEAIGTGIAGAITGTVEAGLLTLI